MLCSPHLERVLQQVEARLAEASGLHGLLAGLRGMLMGARVQVLLEVAPLVAECLPRAVLDRPVQVAELGERRGERQGKKKKARGSALTPTKQGEVKGCSPKILQS